MEFFESHRLSFHRKCRQIRLIGRGTPATGDIAALFPFILLFKVGLETQRLSPGSVPQEQLEQSKLHEQWSHCVQLLLTTEGMCLLQSN